MFYKNFRLLFQEHKFLENLQLLEVIIIKEQLVKLLFKRESISVIVLILFTTCLLIKTTGVLIVEFLQTSRRVFIIPIFNIFWDIIWHIVSYLKAMTL